MVVIGLYQYLLLKIDLASKSNSSLTHVAGVGIINVVVKET
jgi:hypothetical protein